MTVRPLDTLLALKAISLAPDLTENDRRVAAVLLEHFNRRTHQCDPGIERIARLLGISTRTVIRSTERLEAAHLFRKVRHGGHLNRNSYEPVWSRFQEIEAAWSVRFNDTARSRLAGMSPAPSHSRHVPGDRAVTQTCGSNLLNETCQKRLPRKERGEDLESRLSSKTVASGTPLRDAALAAAERRWSAALHQQFASMPITYGEIIQAIDPAMQAAATGAEMRRRGAGLAYVLGKLKIYGIKSVPTQDAEPTEPTPNGSLHGSTSVRAQDHDGPSDQGDASAIAARVSPK